MHTQLYLSSSLEKIENLIRELQTKLSTTKKRANQITNILNCYDVIEEQYRLDLYHIHR